MQIALFVEQQQITAMLITHQPRDAWEKIFFSKQVSNKLWLQVDSDSGNLADHCQCMHCLLSVEEHFCFLGTILNIV